MTRRAVLIVVSCVAAGSLAAQVPRPRLGQAVTRPQGTAGNRTYGFLADTPSSRIVAPGKLEIRFETRQPTPRGAVYLGLSMVGEELDYPRFRVKVAEPAGEPVRSHVIQVDFRGLLALARMTNYEPRIHWRVETWVPAFRSSRFVEGRVYFDPRTKGDTANIPWGPFVDLVGPSSATISWQTDRATDGEVRCLGRGFPSRRRGTDHVVRLEGLRPATTYEYRVRSGRTTTRPYLFRTAGGDRFRFGALVDSREGVGGGLHNYGGVNGFSLRALTSHAYHAGAAFILIPGDLINGYTTSEQDFRRQLDSFRRVMMPVHARIPVFEAMGNHEALMDQLRLPGGEVFYFDKAGAKSAEAVFASIFVNPENGPQSEGNGAPPYAETVYSFDWGNARFLVLNNNYWWSSDPHCHGGNLEGYVLPNQLTWVREQVRRADADPHVQHLFFAAQEPPFPNGGHTGDAMWYRGGDTNRDGKRDARDIDIVGNRNTLWEIVSGSPKTAAFITGDEHSYSRLVVRPETPVGPRHLLSGGTAEFKYPIWQITAGGAGAPWYDQERLPWTGDVKKHSTLPHYALFEVHERTVRLSVYSATGDRIDRCTLREEGRNLDR